MDELSPTSAWWWRIGDFLIAFVAMVVTFYRYTPAGVEDTLPPSCANIFGVTLSNCDSEHATRLATVVLVVTFIGLRLLRRVVAMLRGRRVDRRDT